jgi:dihydropyrimidinase
MYDLVIRGGTVVTPETVLTTDIGIFGEKIAALGDGLEGKAEVDASGKLVLPGAIDPHVHFSLPVGGTVSSDDFYSGSVAAACGGVTTVIDFTVGAPERTMADDLRNRLEDARPSVVDYSFHGEVVGWRPGRTAEISDAMARGIKSFKFFTAYGASGRRTDMGPLYHAFRAIAEGDGVAVVHAEDDSMIEASAALLSKEEWGRMGTVAEVRSDLCEASAVNTVGWIAAKAGVRCHIVHLSSALGLGEVEEARKKGALMTAETCPQYLLLTSGVYGGPQGHLFSATPALRTRNDNEALWRALGSGAVDFAATDHCPFTRTQKEWKGAFDRLPGGLPGVETLLPLLYSEGVLRGKLSLCSLARVTSEQAAKLYGLYPKKGCLFPGSDGDLVIFDPEDAWTIRAGALRMNVDFSPYEGLEVRGKVWQTISRGEIIYADGRFLGRRGRGKFLPR